MINCRYCSKIIKPDAFYYESELGDFCSEDCIKFFIKDEVAKSKIMQVSKTCHNCFHGIEKSESSMFGYNTIRSCSLDPDKNCESISNCCMFIYGNPERREYSFSADNETIVPPIKYVGKEEKE